MKKTLFFILTLCFFVSEVSAQRIELKGFQYRQTDTNAVLECKGVKISRTMVIDSLSCDCDGFWIMKGKKGDKPVTAFWTERFLPRAKNYELKPETYFIYPNLKENSDSAFVTLRLKKK